MTCYAVSELGTVDFVDQLLALDSCHSGLACLLVFSVAVACNCPQTCPSASCLRGTISSVRCWVLAGLNWTEHGSATMYVVGDSGACLLLVVHVCRTVDRVVGHPRPSLSGIGVPWVSLPGPTDVP